MQPDPTHAELLAILDDQKPGMYTHRCGTKDFMIPVLPGPGIAARWCRVCRVGDEEWTRDPDEPRTWAMPVIGPDVRRVRDNRGVTWTRGGTEDQLWVAPDFPTSWTFALLLDERGPLTEVTDDHA